MSDDALESLTIEDRLAVGELIATYNWAMDTNDADLLLSTYAPDGVFSGGMGTFAGHEQLRAQVERRLEDHHLTQHLTSNLLMRKESGEIHASCYCIIVGPAEHGTEIRLSGSYRDRLVRYEGRWVFAARRFEHWG